MKTNPFSRYNHKSTIPPIPETVWPHWVFHIFFRISRTSAIDYPCIIACIRKNVTYKKTHKLINIWKIKQIHDRFHYIKFVHRLPNYCYMKNTEYYNRITKWTGFARFVKSLPISLISCRYDSWGRVANRAFLRQEFRIVIFAVSKCRHFMTT